MVNSKIFVSTKEPNSKNPNPKPIEASSKDVQIIVKGFLVLDLVCKSQ
jgi:hypothetical protein